MNSLDSHAGLRCANCATPLQGDYCHACGQSMHSVLKPVHHMAEETVETVLHIDSRIVRTLPALFFKPGFLSLEYFAGRRVRYIAPFRLMFVLCLLSFFMLHLASRSISVDVASRQQTRLADRGEDFAQAATPKQVRRLLDDKLDALDATQAFGGEAVAAQTKAARQTLVAAANQRLAALHAEPLSVPTPSAPAKPTPSTVAPTRVAWLPAFANQRLTAISQHLQDNLRAYKSGDPAVSEAAKERMLNGIFGKLPGAMFVLVPVFALLLKLFYVFKRRLYMEHVIVVLHSQAFLFLWLLLLTLLGEAIAWLRLHATWAAHPAGWLETILLLWAPAWLLLAQKRVYRQGWPMTLLKYWCIGWCYFWLLLLVLLVATVLGLAH